ncbi:RNA polymerase II mediator complex subunit [Aspergillus pseudonomiae]
MADILTQLQTCLDQLATQFYATVGYLVTYHDNSPAIPPQNDPTAAPALAKITKNSTAPPAPAGAPAASQASPQQAAAQIPGQQQQGGGDAGQTPGAGGTAADPNLPPAPDSPRTFASRQRELARDLVIKEQQIEYLISVLPGIDSSEAEQERKIKELEKELRSAEEDREQRVRELRKLRKKLENVLGGIEVGIYGDRGVVASSR